MKKKPKEKKKLGRKKMMTVKKMEEMKALLPYEIKMDHQNEEVEGEIVDEQEGMCDPTRACEKCQQGKRCENLPNRFGQPTVMTAEVKAKIIEACAWGCSNREAAIYANIALKTLENYNKKDLEFKLYCQELKETPVLHARACVVKAAKTSPFFALKFLERRKSDEWSLKIVQTFAEPEPLTPEEQEALNEVIDENF